MKKYNRQIRTKAWVLIVMLGLSAALLATFFIGVAIYAEQPKHWAEDVLIKSNIFYYSGHFERIPEDVLFNVPIERSLLKTWLYATKCKGIIKDETVKKMMDDPDMEVMSMKDHLLIFNDNPKHVKDYFG